MNELFSYLLQLKHIEDTVSFLQGVDRVKVNKDLANVLKKDELTSFERMLSEKICGEELHTDMVKKAFKKITGKDSNYGWSKDYFYMIVTSFSYELGSKNKLQNLFVKVTEEHFENEGYNVQHMDYSGFLLSDEQILEMAIDRMCRQIEIHYGYNTYDPMFEFEPRFRQCPVMGCYECTYDEKCQHEKEMLKKFRSFVLQYYDEVLNLWQL